MIAFLPIARYRVEYQVASGRPFSSFERLLLKAVRDGHCSVDTLSATFAVHRRLIVEGLVTLMQAGWVLIGEGEKSFVLSPSGMVASEGNTLPPTIALIDRSTTIIVEKVTGQVARSNEIDFQPRKALRMLWDGGVQLRKGDISNMVDPAQVSPLLTHQPTEWIRWIGPITVLSDNAAFAVVDVDTLSGRIIGLPSRWTALLSPECLREARRREADLESAGTSISSNISQALQQFVQTDIIGSTPDVVASRDLNWSALAINPDDVIRSRAEHEKALASAIVHAETYVAIVCPYLDGSAGTALIPLVTSAMDRGLLVNIFLGEMPQNSEDEPRAALAALKKLEYDSAHGTRVGRLSVGTRATTCNTYMVFADANGGATGIVGAYPWCSSQASDSSTSIALRLKTPWAVARLCEIMDGFSSADEKLRLEAGFVRLRKASGDLRQLVGIGSTEYHLGTTFAGDILLQKDHQKVIAAAGANAKYSVRIISDDLAGMSQCGWLRLLIAAAERLGPGFEVTYDDATIPDVEGVPELETLMKSGVRLAKGGRLSGTLILIDDELAILTNSSVNLGSARNSYSSRVGMAIRGRGVRTQLFGLGGPDKDA